MKRKGSSKKSRSKKREDARERKAETKAELEERGGATDYHKPAKRWTWVRFKQPGWKREGQGG